MCFKNLVLLCIFLVLAKITKAEVDCNKPPSPRNHKLGACCNHDLPINEELKEMCLNKIANEQFDVEPPPHPGPHHLLPPRFRCLYECVINETGIYSYEDENIVEDKLDEFLRDGYEPTPEFIPVAKDAIQQCIEKHSQIMTMEKEYPHPPGFAQDQRHHCRDFLFHCMKFEVFKNCPNEYWTESVECNELREFMATCLPPPHLHGPHGHVHGPPPNMN